MSQKNKENKNMSHFYLDRQFRDSNKELLINPVDGKETRVDFPRILEHLDLIDSPSKPCKQRQNRDSNDLDLAGIWDLGKRFIKTRNTNTGHEILLDDVAQLQNLYMLLNLVILLYDAFQKHGDWKQVHNAYMHFSNLGMYPNIHSTVDRLVEGNLQLQCWLKPVLEVGAMVLQALGKIHKDDLIPTIDRVKKIKFEIGQQLHAISIGKGQKNNINIHSVSDPYYLEHLSI